MESGERSSDNDMHSMIKDESWFCQFRNASNPWMARYVYALMFLVANFLAWAVRDFGHKVFPDMEKIKNCKGGGCLGADGVLRVSLGCFVFYVIMFLSTTGTSKLKQHRDSWHSGWWSAKIGLWFIVSFISFLIPAPIVHAYGEIAHFGAGVFLLVQLVSIISFITWLNDWCQLSGKKSEGCHIHVMLLATTAYVICIVGIIMMYIWYVPDSSCLLNIFFISWTLVLVQIMTSVSRHPKVNAGFLTPGLMGLYVVFLCWCAIRSEPVEAKCNGKAAASNGKDWLTIISFVVALLAIVIATFSTGIDSQCFQLRKKDTPTEDDVPYGYGFFHFVFATGAMYFAMLLIGWNTHHTIKRWTIDVGWTSAWVRIVNEWLAVCVYLWMVVAPIILKSRQIVDVPV